MIGQRQNDAPPDLLETAQEEVYRVLEKDWFPKFLQSDVWKRELLKMMYPDLEFDPDELQQILFSQAGELKGTAGEREDPSHDGSDVGRSPSIKSKSSHKSRSSKKSKKKGKGKRNDEEQEAAVGHRGGSDEEDPQPHDPLKFVNLNRKSSLKKKASLGRRSSVSSRKSTRSTRSSKSGKSAGSDSDEPAGKGVHGDDDREIFPPPGVALKRWVSQPSRYDSDVSKWVSQTGTASTPATPSSSSAPATPTSPVAGAVPSNILVKQLSVTTYNVSRELFGSKHRHGSVLEALRTLDSTFIVLQVPLSFISFSILRF